MYQKTSIIWIMLLWVNSSSFAQNSTEQSNYTSSTVQNLFFTALAALAGYLGKSTYEIYIEKKKRKRVQLENKLKFFYWPIHIRLKENQSTYKYLFKGKMAADHNSQEYRVAHYVEKNVLLKNHQQIVDIITNFRFLADTDSEFEGIIDAYVKHVAIYKSFLEAGIEQYPGVAGQAPYPTRIDNYFSEKTIKLQNLLESMNI